MSLLKTVSMTPEQIQNLIQQKDELIQKLNESLGMLNPVTQSLERNQIEFQIDTLEKDREDLVKKLAAAQSSATTPSGETTLPSAKATLDEIENLASSENLKKAIKQFISFLEAQNDEDLITKLRLVKGNLAGLEDEVDQSLITNEEANTRRSRIRRAILNYVEKARDLYEA